MNNIEFKGTPPKGKEKERLYYTLKLENVKVNHNSTFIKALDKLVKGEITEIDLKKVKQLQNDNKI